MKDDRVFHYADRSLLRRKWQFKRLRTGGDIAGGGTAGEVSL